MSPPSPATGRLLAPLSALTLGLLLLANQPVAEAAQRPGRHPGLSSRGKSVRHPATARHRDRGASGRSRRSGQIAGFNFDWDDNIIAMPTRIWLRNKTGGAPLGVSTAEFALVAPQLGNAGAYRDYDIDPDPASGSMREFRDHRGGPNQFLDHLKVALEAPDSRGPSWDAFVTALGDRRTARDVTIITARGHSPAKMMEALRYLKQRGVIRHLPRRENLFAVTYKGFKLDGHKPPATMSAAERKARVMIERLDRLNQIQIGRTAKRVTSPDGRGRRRMQLWGFSDDDFGNFSKGVAVLGKEIAAGRWPNVKVSLFFTGPATEHAGPSSVVLKSDGSARPLIASERGEVNRVLSN